MKKALLLLQVLILLSILSSCKKEGIEEDVIDNDNSGVIIEEGEAIIQIEETENIHKSNLIVSNGNTSVNAATTNVIPITMDYSSASTLDGDLVYLYNSVLDPAISLDIEEENDSTKTSSKKSTNNDDAVLKLNAKETARNIIFLKSGLALISPTDDFTKKIGHLIEYGAQSAQFKEFVDVVTADLKTAEELTTAVLNHPIAENMIEYISTLMNIESLIV
ncbi:hypothetical protein OAA06_02435, partial [bacterium]|nr:hypothetical protein [bacterium]